MSFPIDPIMNMWIALSMVMSCIYIFFGKSFTVIFTVLLNSTTPAFSIEASILRSMKR